MAQTLMVQSLGDSLRELAARIDQVPALPGAVTFPDFPLSMTVDVRTVEVLEKLAADFGVAVEYSNGTTMHRTAFFTVHAGGADLRVFSIERLRELRRPVDVTEQIEAVES